MQSLIIHGRQPKLGRVELESIYGEKSLKAIGEVGTLIAKDPTEIDFMQLGGMVKFCKVLTTLDTVNWSEITDYLCKVAPNHAKSLDGGKLTIGLSTFGLKTTVRSIAASGIKTKKAIKKTGRSVRIVPNSNQALNSASVLHNKLTSKLGWELIFVRTGNKTIIGQTIAVQDIDKYAARDQARPYRDAKVGMLPPKLAQIIINLAVGKLERNIDCSPKELSKNIKISSSKRLTLLDPFCGSGVILQEAALMGIDIYGSDNSDIMVDYSMKNIAWLRDRFAVDIDSSRFEVADATQNRWPHEFDVIASEIFLGKPLTSLPEEHVLNKVIAECDFLFNKFLINIATQKKSGFKMCLAVPAWKTKNGFKHLKTLDKMADLGYNRVKFEFSSTKDLIYHRSNQTVARELVVLERK